jgi:hypothetical protein
MKGLDELYTMRLRDIGRAKRVVNNVCTTKIVDAYGL